MAAWEPPGLFDRDDAHKNFRFAILLT